MWYYGNDFRFEHLANNAGTEDGGNYNRYENYITDYEITGSNSFTCAEVEVYEVVPIY